jgi:flagellar protein FlbD
VIEITRLNGQKLIINADLIETIESTPDTVILLTTGKRFIVADTVATIIDKVIDYRRTIGAWPLHDGDERN